MLYKLIKMYFYIIIVTIIIIIIIIIIIRNLFYVDNINIIQHLCIYVKNSKYRIKVSTKVTA